MSERGSEGYYEQSGEPFWQAEQQRITLAARDEDVQDAVREINRLKHIISGPEGFFALKRATERADIAAMAVMWKYDLLRPEYKNKIIGEADRIQAAEDAQE